MLFAEEHAALQLVHLWVSIKIDQVLAGFSCFPTVLIKLVCKHRHPTARTGKNADLGLNHDENRKIQVSVSGLTKEFCCILVYRSLLFLLNPQTTC